jgi:SMP-30/Gluconolactonase/LRE-like region
MQIKLPRAQLGALAVLAAAAVTGSVLVSVASGDTKSGPPTFRGSFTTVFKAPLGIEGLTGGPDGNLYSAGRGADPCPVWRVSPSGGPATVVGNIPAPCGPTGIAFDAAGRIYTADDDQILVFTPNAASPPTATVFANGVPGANGIAFDRRGDLWVSDGGTAQGRVWRVGSDGVPTDVFRVQPMANDVNLVSGVGGVGRDPRSLPPGTVTITPTGRSAANTLGSQHLVANGLAFTENGILFVADTARGAIWRVEFDRRGRLTSPVGCDTTFTANTLCLDNVFVAHPFLEGADGIALDRADNIWVAATSGTRSRS